MRTAIPSPRLRHLGVGLLAVLGLLSGVVAAAEAQIGNGNPPAQASEWANGERAIAQLGDRLPDVARAYGVRANVLRSMFRDDSTLSVDQNGELLYVEPAIEPPLESATTELPGDIASAPPTTDPVFSLSSRPGADHTIYLDFDGHVSEGTSWNNAERTSITSPSYDTDGAPDTWSTNELLVIRASFEAVAEDFAPFDINVTTVEPPVGDLVSSGVGDSRWGTRVVITDDSAGLCGCGGIAYIGSFDDRTDEPVFVFNTSRTGVIEAISHEVGHAMLLSHDGQIDLNNYYRGHGSGDSSWGTIMGAAYNRTVTQWSSGEYVAANNIGADANFGYGEDDLQVLSSLTNGNGFGYISDDHGNDLVSATPIGSGVINGTISTTNDVDVFIVQTQGGLSIDLNGHPTNPNLDPSIEVRTLDGTVVATSDDAGQLSASIELPALAAGQYVIVVDGTGWGTPLATSPTGWTEYGSLGNYEMSVQVQDGPGDNEAPSTPTGLAVTSTSQNEVGLSWTPNSEADLASYSVERSNDDGASWSVIAEAVSRNEFANSDLAPSTTYSYRIRASDVSGNTSEASTSITATTLDVPVEPAGADFVVAETPVSGTVTGGFALTTATDGNTQVLTEASSGGRPNRRHDLLEHIWQIDASNGNHILMVDADITDAGDADTGFTLSWSTSTAGPWSSLGEVTAARGSLVADLGAPTGSIFVRITDTDRTARNTAFDRIAVDRIELGGGTPPTEPPVVVSSTNPADGAVGISTSPTLSWTPVAGATEYRVTVAGDVGIPTQSTTGNSVIVDGLSNGVTYQWQIEAINELGSSVSQVFRFTTAEQASTVSVDSLSIDTVSAGRGTRRAVVTAVVLDDQGMPVAGAQVTVEISGSIAESVTGTTNTSGIVQLTTTQAAKKPTVSACVGLVSAGELSWAPSNLACP